MSPQEDQLWRKLYGARAGGGVGRGSNSLFQFSKGNFVYMCLKNSSAVLIFVYQINFPQKTDLDK